MHVTGGQRIPVLTKEPLCRLVPTNSSLRRDVALNKIHHVGRERGNVWLKICVGFPSIPVLQAICEQIASWMMIRVAKIGAQFLETWGMAWVLFTSKEVTHRLNIDLTPGTHFLLFIFDFRLLVPSISQRKLVMNDLIWVACREGLNLRKKSPKTLKSTSSQTGSDQEFCS